MKKIALLLATCLISVVAFAQDFPYGEPDNDALNMKHYDKDTSAHALVLNEHGLAKIVVTNADDVNLIFEYHAKIKFFDDKEFERYGTVEIPIYSSDGMTYEKLNSVKAITYYKDDNGNTQRAELDPKKNL